MGGRALRTTVVGGCVVVLCAVAVLAASAVNWAAADQRCGSLFAFDPRFADARGVSFENRLFPFPVDCHFDNGITLSQRWWWTAAP